MANPAGSCGEALPADRTRGSARPGSGPSGMPAPPGRRRGESLSDVARNAYIPIRARCRRPHGRTQQRPACRPPRRPVPGQEPTASAAIRGRATSTLTRPRARHCQRRPEPVKGTRLDRTRPTGQPAARRTRRPPQQGARSAPSQAAARPPLNRQATRGPGDSRPGRVKGRAQRHRRRRRDEGAPWTRAGRPPDNRTPGQGTPPPVRPPPESPGQDGYGSQHQSGQSQQTVQNRTGRNGA
jgi:hypothetical protein